MVLTRKQLYLGADRYVTHQEACLLWVDLLDLAQEPPEFGPEREKNKFIRA